MSESERQEQQQDRSGKTGNGQLESSARRDATSRLLHYSDKPISRVKSCQQGGPWKSHRYDKPVGLWLSVEGEDDWRSWCEAESFGEPAKQLCYEVTLAPSARILRLSGVRAILAFTRRHGFDPYFGPDVGRTIMAGRAIRWDVVAQSYDGIVIAPYCWKLRHDDRTGWYYGWDCASDCIWNADAIARLARVTSTERLTHGQTATCDPAFQPELVT